MSGRMMRNWIIARLIMSILLVTLASLVLGVLTIYVPIYLVVRLLIILFVR
jgi:hypothetical protein